MRSGTLRRLCSTLALLALWTSSGCGVPMGLTGDESPLTGRWRNLSVVPMQPAWRRELNQGDVYLGKPHELAVAAYSSRLGRVAVGTRNGWFYCLRATNGDVLWRHRLPGGASAQAIFDGDRVLTGTDDGQLIAFDSESGRIVWSHDVTGAIIEAPVVSGERVIFVDGTNTVYAVSRATGEWLWQYRRNPPADFALVGEARPLVTSDRVFAGFSDGNIVALSVEDGALVWSKDLAPEHTRFQDIDMQPRLVGGTLFAASAASGLYAMDPETGKVRWTLPVAGIVAALDYDDDLILSSDRGLLFRVDGRTGRTVWRVRFGDGAPTEAVIVWNVAVVGTSKGGLYFLNPATGRPLRRFLTGQGFSASATAGSDGAVYALSNGGVLYAFRPHRRRLHARP